MFLRLCRPYSIRALMFESKAGLAFLDLGCQFNHVRVKTHMLNPTNRVMSSQACPTVETYEKKLHV